MAIFVIFFSNRSTTSNSKVSMVTLSEVDRRFQPRSGQTKDCEIDIRCFSAKHTALRRKSKDWLSRNQGNVSQDKKSN